MRGRSVLSIVIGVVFQRWGGWRVTGLLQRIPGVSGGGAASYEVMDPVSELVTGQLELAQDFVGATRFAVPVVDPEAGR
jgi:hypothetical protein